MPESSGQTDSLGYLKVTGAVGGVVSYNGDSYAINRTFANVTASQTDSNIVSAVASKQIIVISVACVTGATATNATFNTKPAGAGTAISMLFANGANGGFILPANEDGWFATNAGEGLTVTTGAGSTTGIQCNYILV